ncbi:MAG: GNAT family N-acetyltransferase [Chloroflexota bacterium]
MRVEPRDLASIPRAAWDRLAAANPWATPFSAWAFQRAWWDAYGDNAHEQTLVLVAADAPAAPSPRVPGGAFRLERDGSLGPGPSGDDILAIIPLMHRHAVEPGDAERHTTLRHDHGADLTPVPATSKAIYFGASYHADYATVLARPVDLPALAEALVEHLCEACRPGSPEQPWDVVDLRRLRCEDPTGGALAAAFRRREIAEGWTLNLEREDACPVVSLPVGGTIDDLLATLAKKVRHEIRRKVRRAEAAGVVELRDSTDPLADLEMFIDLHQRRWGDEGLFPPTIGGLQSRVFVRRLFELFGPDGAARLSFLTVGGRRIAAGLTFETPDVVLYYNAGVEPDARDLSPGVVLVERLIRRALARGQRRFDFLRGDEGYKYEWGGADEPIQRLLVRRRVVA